MIAKGHPQTNKLQKFCHSFHMSHILPMFISSSYNSSNGKKSISVKRTTKMSYDRNA